MHQQSHNRSLILASSSPYRKILLERLGLPFEVFSPDVDESLLEGEEPDALVARLAGDKSGAAARRFPSAVVVGSDQIAIFKSTIIGKPGNAANARKQLSVLSGRNVCFLSAVSVRCKETGFLFERTIPTNVRFRKLSVDEIERYVARDNPVDCAGGFKSEETGTSLLLAMESRDPTAIIGLPLIAVSEALRKAGFQVP